MIQKEFIDRLVPLVKADPSVIGLAAGGSWITNELDEYSDIDLVLVTKQKISGDKEKMLEYAKSFGEFISGFTGDHVGEPRLLICLYDNPLLHVDIKFLTLDELKNRVEDPIVLFERNGKLTEVLQTTKAEWPQTDFQWIEDRFWTWVHYTATKIGRGEFFEALTAIDFLRAQVLSKLMQLKNQKKARGTRKVETELSKPDLENLKITIAQYNRKSIITALDNIISIYRTLRKKLYSESITLQTLAEKKSMQYFKEIKQKS